MKDQNLEEFYNIDELSKYLKEGMFMLLGNYNKGFVYTPLDHIVCNISYRIIDKQIKKYKRIRKMNHERNKKKNFNMAIH